MGELQRCALNICRFALRTIAMERPWKSLDALLEDHDAFIFEPIKFEFEKKDHFTVTLEHDGRYKFIVKARSALPDLAQSVCNLMLNGQAAATIQTNGTKGEWVLLKLNNIDLTSGTYEVSLETVKAGIEIQWISMTK